MNFLNVLSQLFTALAAVVASACVAVYLFQRISAYVNKKINQYPDSEPYFARHYDRDVYVSLLQREDAEASPDALLKAALLKRAATNMARLARIKEDKPALHNLHQRGCVGEGLWKDALAAEKELQAEIIETMNEAESFTPGWGHLIHASGQEIAQNESTLKLLRSTEDRKREAALKYGIKYPFVAPPAPALPPAGPGSSATRRGSTSSKSMPMETTPRASST